MSDIKICQLERFQIDAASEIGAKAFENDPVMSYLTSDDRKLRLQALTWLMSKTIAYASRYGHVYTTQDLQGVAAWLPPGKFASDPVQLIQMAWELQLYALPLQVGWHRLGRWLNYLTAIDRSHQQDLGDLPHWYLGIMVVQPVSQGQGIGSQLLQPILARASEEGLPCYLVTFTEQAVEFYQKNGFEIVQEQKPESEAPKFWTLKRNP